MNDKDLDPKFSWTVPFIVTGLCFFIFSFILKLLNDGFPSIFLWIGIASSILGCISGASLLFQKEPENDPSQEQIDQ